MTHKYTVHAYVCGTVCAEAQSAYVLPTCVVDTCLSELGGTIRI